MKLAFSRHAARLDRMRADVQTIVEREGELRRAIERGEFEAFYQPIVALDTVRMSGFEALVRWRHPRHGMVAPAQFVPLAEETGLIVAIDRWMLRTACEQMVKWDEQTAGRAELWVSVNISGAHLLRPDFFAHVEAVLDEMGVAPNRLHLEITEDVLIEEPKQAAAALRRLSARGVHIALDDFGAGYLSLDNLRCFPIETVKIDRSFTQGEGDDASGMVIVRGIASRAHSLSMRVVAEGIERAEQIPSLRAAGCNFGQGYYFSRPKPSTDAGY